jgi:uncharacterized protein YegJ (DUF2314 family)
MGTVIGHVVAGIFVIWLGRRLHWPWWAVAAALAGAAVLVHSALERGRRAGGHLGAWSVAHDDPLMLAALEDARRTWSAFLGLYRDHPQTAIVKFRLRTTAGNIENVWGDLLALDGERATVSLRTPPLGRTDVRDPRMTVPVTDIIDWQVMLPDGSLRGGFTQQATFRIIERDRGRLSGKFAEQLARYRPLEAPASARTS